MNPTLDETQLLLRDTVRQYLEAEVPFSRIRDHEESGKADEALWSALLEQGWIGSAFPESVGGGDGTLVEAGLKSVQLSFQDVDPARGDAVAGVSAHGRKLEFAEHVKSQGLPLVLNVVLHRENLPRVGELIELAASLGAERLELANTQYHGWALRNRDALLPSRDAVAEASRVVEEARRRYRKPEILFVLPDYFTDRPKPCMGGWARKTLVVTPSGQVLPCHGAAELNGRVSDTRCIGMPEGSAAGAQTTYVSGWRDVPCRC